MRIPIAAALAACLAAGARPACAQETFPAALLQSLDAALARGRYCVGTLTIVKDGSTKTLSYKLKGGDEIRELRLTAPDDVKGMKYIMASEAVYVVLPAYGDKLRRLGPGSLGKPFFGSLLSVADMLELPFEQRWTAVAANDLGAEKALDLRLKAAEGTVPNLLLNLEGSPYWIKKASRIVPLPPVMRTVKEQTCFASEPPGFDADMPKTR